MDFEVGIAQSSAIGEIVCGDGYVISSVNGTTLFGVVDGLGHGPAAAEAAEAFVAYVSANSDGPLEEIMLGASEHLTGTRGAAAALVRIDRKRRLLEFTGVGNIAFQSAAASPIRPVSVPGIVGQRIRKLRPFLYDLPQQTVFALWSDGVSSRFDITPHMNLSAQRIADIALEEHCRGHDDATCVVVKCDEGGAAEE